MLKVIFEDYRISKVMQDDVKIKNVMSVGYENDPGSNIIIQLSLPPGEVQVIHETNHKKPKFRLEEYNGKYVMHCDTEEKAERFCRFLHKQGRKWNSGKSYLHDTYWNTYKEETCYLFNEDMFGDLYFYERYITLEFDDFDWEE